jgi:glutathione peroxidase
MTLKQRLLKLVYPLWMLYSRVSQDEPVLKNEKNIQPAESIYDLSVLLNTGETVSLSQYAGKKILLVNTASDCGYTDQYDELQQLYAQEQQKLVVIGFPANDFKQQEKGSDEQIAEFCRLNYGITFPLSKKSVVVKSAEQHAVFRWLTDKKRNGWNEKEPSWNFSKYLINEAGVLTHYFDPAVSPMSKDLISQV